MNAVKRAVHRHAVLCVVVLLLAPTPSAIASVLPALAVRDEACLACHDSPLAVKALADGGTLPLFVDRETYAASVHAARGCGGCHTDIDPAAHPSGRPIADRGTYVAERSKSCRTCHPGPKTGPVTVHDVLLARAEAPPCSTCHLPHGISRLNTWRNEISGTRYCLSCHFGEIQVAFSADETSIPPPGTRRAGSPSTSTMSAPTATLASPRPITRCANSPADASTPSDWRRTAGPATPTNTGWRRGASMRRSQASRESGCRSARTATVHTR